MQAKRWIFPCAIARRHSSQNASSGSLNGLCPTTHHWALCATALQRKTPKAAQANGSLSMSRLHSLRSSSKNRSLPINLSDDELIIDATARRFAQTGSSVRVAHVWVRVVQRQVSAAGCSAEEFSCLRSQQERARPEPAASTDRHSPGSFPSGSTQSACP